MGVARQRGSNTTLGLEDNAMYRFSLLVTSAVAALWSAPAQAQQQRPPCAHRADFLNHLSANYKEAPVAMGLTANGGLLEVVASKDGSWTSGRRGTSAERYGWTRRQVAALNS